MTHPEHFVVYLFPEEQVEILLVGFFMEGPGVFEVVYRKDGQWAACSGALRSALVHAMGKLGVFAWHKAEAYMQAMMAEFSDPGIA